MKNNRAQQSAFWGAAFLMATSAIGPGFLTQTAYFTQQLAASFGFAILVSILVDIGVQLNIWRIVLAFNKPAQEIANGLVPGLGILLSVLIFLGGIAFNIGNIAGAGLGVEVLTGMDNRYGALLSAGIAILLLVSGNAIRAMDRFVQALGILMIGLTCYIAFASAPPLSAAIAKTFIPDKVDWRAIITIVGGTVGGYICFAGAHRLLDAGMQPGSNMRGVSISATRGIITVSIMRYLLFLAAFGVIHAGMKPDPENPAAGVFLHAAGQTGYRIFGLVLWSAAITSVIGSAYTAVSFIRNWNPVINQRHTLVLACFIIVSTLVFLWVGKPVKLLLFAGMANGFILPLSLAILLAAMWKVRMINGYQHPKWLYISGLLIAVLLAGMALQVLIS